MGKRKMAETDSDDSDGDSESDDSDAENEKSAVTDNGSQSDSSKDASNGSISVTQFAGDNKGRGTSDSNSEEEKETPPSIAVETDANQMESSIQSSGDGHVETSSDTDEKMLEKPCVPPEVAPATVQCISDQMPNTSDFVHEDSECKTTAPEEVVVGSSIVSDVPKPLNFDDFVSASALEVLGMERLKSELQERGLKCGGTLQERAARLFLLKTTPLEKLPKKLLAKK